MAFRLLGKGCHKTPSLRGDLEASWERYTRTPKSEAAEAFSAPTPGRPLLKLVWVNPRAVEKRSESLGFKRCKYLLKLL
jgi:hypothetical protein